MLSKISINLKWSALILCSCLAVSAGEGKHSGYKLLQGTPENNVAIFADKDSNCVMYTEYLGDNFGVLVRCLMSKGIVSEKAIRAKVKDLIVQFVPKKYQNSIVSEFTKNFNSNSQRNNLRIDIAGYTECFVEVDYLSESVMLTIKCVR